MLKVSTAISECPFGIGASNVILIDSDCWVLPPSGYMNFRIHDIIEHEVSNFIGESVKG